MSNKAEDYIHTGPRNNWYKGEYKPDLTRCRYSVAEHGRVTDWHQCERKPVETVDDYGFCTIHAREVKRKLGYAEANFVRYVAKFNGKPHLSKANVVRETEKTIEISDWEDLMGDLFLMSGLTRKDSTYFKSYKFFNEFTDAIAWLYEQSESHVQSTLHAYEAAIQVRNKLEAEFLELAPKEEL